MPSRQLRSRRRRLSEAWSALSDFNLLKFPDKALQIRQRGPSLRFPGRSVALNSLAETAIQKIPPGIIAAAAHDPELRVQIAVELRAQARPPGTEFLDAETGRQKPPLKRTNTHRDQNPGIEWPEIRAETPYLASYRKRVVCKGWVVVAPGLEPGSR